MNTHTLNPHTVRKRIELSGNCSSLRHQYAMAAETGIPQACHPPHMHRQALKGLGLTVPTKNEAQEKEAMKANHTRAADSLPAGVFQGDSIPAGTFHGDSIPPGTFHGDSIPAGTFH